MNTRSISRPSRLVASVALGLSAVLSTSACSGGGGGGGAGTADALGSFTFAGEVVSLDPGDMTTSIEANGPAGYAVHGFARDDAQNLLYAFDSERGTLLRIDGSGRVRRVGNVDEALGYMVFDPGDDTLLGLVGGNIVQPSRMIRIDPETTEVLDVKTVGPRVHAVAFDRAQGRLLAIAATSGGVPSNNLIAIDVATGSTTPLFEHVTFHTLNGITFDPVTRLLWGVDDLGGLYAFDLFSELIEEAYFFERPLQDVDIDSDSGRFFALSTGGAVMRMTVDGVAFPELDVVTTLGRELRGLTHDPAANRYFAVDGRNGELVTVDPRSGRATAIGLLPLNPFGERRDVRSLAFDPMLGELWGFDARRGEMIAIDPTTGDCAEIGLTAGVEMLITIDPGTGRLYGYDESVEVLVEIDPHAPAKHLLDNAIGLTKVDALTFDPVTQRIVAIHETPGHVGVTTVSSIALQGTSGPLPHSRAPEGITAFGRDADTGRFHAFGMRQPWFELELDLSSGSYTRQRIVSHEGVWRTGYRAALAVPARGVVYAIDAELLYEYDRREREMRLLGAFPEYASSQDLLWDPAGRLGLRRGDEVVWVDPDLPHHSSQSSQAPGTSGMRMTCDASTGRVFGVQSGLLFDVTLGSGASASARTPVAIPDLDVDAVAFFAGDVFAMGTRGISPERVLVRFDTVTGEWSEAGTTSEPLLALFGN